jgi:hypothetical protein
MSDATLDGFLRRLATVNPFLENRINGPSLPPGDVFSIHQVTFERLTGLARQVLLTRSGLGAVLWGEAGIGKSHVLARLARWAKAGHARLVYLHNLQCAPDALPRTLLGAVVTTLTKGRRERLANTPLGSLVRAGVVEAAGGPSKYSWSQLEQAWQRWLDAFAPRDGGRSVHDVLFTFFRSAAKAASGLEDGQLANLAVRWLSGGALAPEEARQLGLPPGRHRDDPVSLEDALQIKQVLVALARLAVSERRPLILALDQVDSLDAEQFGALTRFAEALLDSAPGLLVVTSGLQATLTRWYEEHAVQPSAWDRLAQFKFLLTKLTPAQAEELVRARLNEFLSPFAEVEEVIEWRLRDRLFPLGQGWQRQALLPRAELRPRDVMSLARDGWQAQQERLGRVGLVSWLMRWPGEEEEPAPPAPVWSDEQRQAAIDQAVSRELDALRAQLLAQPVQITSDADRLAAALHELLQQAGPAAGVVDVARGPAPRRGVPPAYHLSLWRRSDEGEHITGVLVLAMGTTSAVAGSLGRLVEDSRPLDRVVVVTDERAGMPLGEKGKEHLEELQSRGLERFALFQLHFAELVDLEVLSRLLGRARSREVEIEPPGGPREALTPHDVASSATWRKRFAEHRLLADLLRNSAVATA